MLCRCAQGQKGRKGHKGKRGQGPATTDTQLMARLGANMSSMRLDFIVAHLVPSCSFCRKYHSGADYW